LAAQKSTSATGCQEAAVIFGDSVIGKWCSRACLIRHWRPLPSESVPARWQTLPASRPECE
jgi:hypothetical protein